MHRRCLQGSGVPALRDLNGSVARGLRLIRYIPEHPVRRDRSMEGELPAGDALSVTRRGCSSLEYQEWITGRLVLAGRKHTASANKCSRPMAMAPTDDRAPV